MTYEPIGSVTPPPPADNDPRADGVIRAVFLNSEGLRSGWRLLIYVVLVVIFFLAIKRSLSHFWKSTPGTISIASLFVAEVVGFASTFGAAVVMSFIERRPAGSYGLPASSAFGKFFWQGWLIGLLDISALMGLIAAFGGYSFGHLELHGGEIMRWAVLWGTCTLFVGLFEEFLFRGYTLATFTQGIGFWPAAIITSLLFGSVHWQNSGEGVVGVAAVVLVGMLWCFSVSRTGSLWFAVGMHAAFDFGESFLFSVPNSGMVFPGHLSNASLPGRAWLTGGTVGPEASVFDFLLFLLLFLVIHLLYPAKKAVNQNSVFQGASDANLSS